LHSLQPVDSRHNQLMVSPSCSPWASCPCTQAHGFSRFCAVVARPAPRRRTLRQNSVSEGGPSPEGTPACGWRGCACGQQPRWSTQVLLAQRSCRQRGRQSWCPTGSAHAIKVPRSALRRFHSRCMRSRSNPRKHTASACAVILSSLLTLLVDFVLLCCWSVSRDCLVVLPRPLSRRHLSRVSRPR
jgi:hypothetical protein